MAVSYIDGAAKGQTTEDALFPYKRHTVSIDGNAIQYIDEGEGTPIVLLHPLPAWSIIYREFIPILRAEFRCIAVDVPGFGYSRAVPSFEQTPRNHAGWIARLLEVLDLNDAVLYLHDSFGAAGLWAVLEQRPRVAGLVLSNTFAWPLDDYPATRRFLTMISRTIPGALILRMMMPRYFRGTRPSGIDDWSPTEKRAYLDQFGGEQRDNMRALFRNILKDRPFYDMLEQRLPELGDLPVYLPWGTEDGLIELGWLNRFEQIFPNHETFVVEGASHFPQEYAPQEIAAGILKWWLAAQKSAQ